MNNLVQIAIIMFESILQIYLLVRKFLCQSKSVVKQLSNAFLFEFFLQMRYLTSRNTIVLMWIHWILHMITILLCTIMRMLSLQMAFQRSKHYKMFHLDYRIFLQLIYWQREYFTIAQHLVLRYHLFQLPHYVSKFIAYLNLL